MHEFWMLHIQLNGDSFVLAERKVLRGCFRFIEIILFQNVQKLPVQKTGRNGSVGHFLGGWFTPA